MNIAILADDNRKELVAEFCLAYSHILAKHKIFATGTTAKYIADASGLQVEKLLSGSLGGEAQLSLKIAYGEVDLLILALDVQNQNAYATSMVQLMRNCDMNNVPAATNIATAEALVLALDRGDLDWRSINKSATL